MKPLEILKQCPQCDVSIGELHQPGCSVERCPFCGSQMLVDTCCYRFFGIDVATMDRAYPDIYANGLNDEMSAIWEDHLRPHLIPWDGVWPGVRECREYGLWCKWTSSGWLKCGPDDPDAQEDLNELIIRASWDKEKKRYVLA